MNNITPRKKILWSVPRSFLPFCDGASRANDALLKSFFLAQNSISNEFDVTLLIFIASKDITDISLLKNKYLTTYPIKDVIFLKKNLLGIGIKRIFQIIKNLFCTDPVTASFFNLPENCKTLHRLSQCSFDYILVDGLHTYCGLKNMFSSSLFIYRSHNVEYNLWNGDDESLLVRFILNSQSQKMKILEHELISKACVTWSISNDDRSTYINDFHLTGREADKIEYLPMALAFHKSHSVVDSFQFNFLFVGKLDWPPNHAGLKWFLKEVAPFLNDNIHVSIVGKGNFPISDYQTLERVEFLGFVEELDDLYQKHDGCLIPIFSGSGTRIKVLEALSWGIPLLTTSFGIQGSAMDSSHCFISNEASKWINYLNSWDRRTAIGKVQKGQNDLELLYSFKSIGDKFKNL